MNKPIILADESLVLNGDFESSFDDWTMGPINDHLLGVDRESYGGVPVNYLIAMNKASVSQEMAVPKKPDTKARYFISFLCENRHTDDGLLVVSVKDQPDNKLEIALRVGDSRDAQRDQARLAKGLPLEFEPIEYESPLDLPFDEHDKLIVDVSCAANQSGDFISAICITRIKIRLQLEPAVLQSLKLDDQTVRTPTPLYLCLGASHSLPHQLGFVLDPDNAWVGTQAALTIDNNPGGALVATPDWGVDQAVEQPWTLDCPLIGNADPYVFSMNLVNQYTADPYPLEVSLGHHRLNLNEVQEPAYYPVLELSQSVRVGVRVTSFYTDQPLSGRQVNWTAPHQGVLGAGISDENGWVFFDYVPTKAGEFEIEASVDSPYYATGIVTRTFAVRVLATDPWKDVLAVIERTEAPWAAKTGYPNRGSSYPVELKLPDDSPLLGTTLALRWSGVSHEQLGVVVSPALGTPLPVEELPPVWTLTSEDRLDGDFQLELVCSKLQLPSPEKTMKLARNRVKIGQVREANKFPVVDEEEHVLLRIQVVHVVTSGTGDPVVNALVEWTTPDGLVSPGITGAGGWASFLYTPTSAGDKVVTASIRAHAEGLAVEHPFPVKAIATSPWKNEVKILLDGVEVERNTLGVLCRRGQTHTLKVVPNSGSPWIGKQISLHWRGPAPNIGLVPSDLATLKPIVATGVEWTLASQVNGSTSSMFDLEFHMAGQPDRELTGRLMAADLSEEMSVRLDQIAAGLDARALYPCLGAQHRFSILPNALSPLVGLDLSLTWSGTSAEQLSATVEPALDQTVAINDDGAIWTLGFTASPEPGEFALTVKLPQLDFAATAKSMTLAHNKVRIEASRESAVDPVVGQEPAWLWVQVFSHFTGQAVDGVAVAWAGTDSSVVPTNAEGWSGFAVAPKAAGTRTVKASVSSRYDDYEDRRFMEVEALASDPWADLMVRFDGGAEHRWGDTTYFPRRKGEHALELSAAENSPLFDRDLTLGLIGTGPAELGIRFLTEGLGAARLFTREGLRYLLQIDDLKDGSFALRLSSTRLASLSPTNAMSLGEGSQVMKIRSEYRVSRTLDWGESISEQVTVVSTVSNRPMAGKVVTWSGYECGDITSITDYYGVAKVHFKPTISGLVKVTATLENGEQVMFDYFLSEPRRISDLTSPKQTGTEMDLAQATATVLSIKTGLPLPGVEVKWKYAGVDLPPTHTNEQGMARVDFRFSGGLKNLLIASVTGGDPGRAVKTLQFETIARTATSPVSDGTWQRNLRPFLDGKRFYWDEPTRLDLKPGKTHTLTLEYQYSTLAGTPEGWVSLLPNEDASFYGLVFDPPMGQECEMKNGAPYSLTWTINTETADALAFELQFDLPRYAQAGPSPLVPADLTVLRQDAKINFDERKNLDFTGRIYPCHGGTHELHIWPRPGCQLVDQKVQLIWSGAHAEDLEVVIEPPISMIRVMPAGGLTWRLMSTRETGLLNSLVALELKTLNESFGPKPLVDLSFGHNLVTAERGVVESDGHQHDTVELTSVHTQAPADNTLVQYVFADREYPVITDIQGYAEHHQYLDGKFVVMNPYDGSEV
ncbi:MAG: hypothetical protein ACOH2P_15575 [Pseudomonas sp.]